MTKRASRGAGFTLIEILVALAIMALSFGLAFDGCPGAFDRIGRSHERTAAMLVAQSTLDRVGHDILLADGHAAGVTREGFSWLVEAAPYDADQVPPVRADGRVPDQGHRRMDRAGTAAASELGHRSPGAPGSAIVRTPCAPGPANGFTLLEVLVALVVLGLLGGAIGTGMRFAGRAWAEAEKRTEADADMANVEAFIRRSIAAATPSFASADANDPAVEFDGSTDQLVLTTAEPGTDARGPLVRLRLFVAPHGRLRALFASWRRNPPDSSRVADPPALLLDHVAALRLRYFGSPSLGAAPAWGDRWSGRESLPDLVGVVLERDDPAHPRWPELVAAPRATTDSTCIFDAVSRGCRRR